MLTLRLSEHIKAAVSHRVWQPVGQCFAALIAVLAVQLIATPPMHAQGLVSVGVGVGGGVGDRNKDESGSGVHGAGYVQLHVPVIPIALRGDLLVAKTVNNGNALAVMADAVYLAPIPVVSPYALAGYGSYGVGKDGTTKGWNAGVGVRVRTPVIAFYVEGRRHQRISRDLLTIGISR